MKKQLLPAFAIAALVLVAVYVWGGWKALVLAATLAVLEVALSFDNAVVNARVLERMPPRWQNRFLTWGMLFSVGGMRLILPVLIVSAVTLVSPLVIAGLAFTDPAQYAVLVAGSGPAVKAFGGVFLLLVALNYFFDPSKKVHWIAWVERHFVRWGTIESAGIGVALLALMIAAAYGHAQTALVLVSGLIGVVLFIVLQALAEGLGFEAETTTSNARSGLALFLYLDMLDAVFSLDGVVGAFALTSQLIIIVAGLGIGAYFVRSLTLVLARGKALKELIYLEHGAHYAIAALAVCMLLALVLDVSEWVTASVGLVCIVAAYISSRRAIARSL